MSENRRRLLSRVVSGLVLAAALATLGLAWWLSDAVLVRSEVTTISRDAAEMLAVVGTAMRYILIPAVSVVALLAVWNLVLCFRYPHPVVGSRLNRSVNS